MQIQPLLNNVLVQPIEKKKEQKTGIVLPDAVNKENVIEGMVTAIGKGEVLPVTLVSVPGGVATLARTPSLVQVNDRVLFNKQDATPIKASTETVYLLNQRDILGIITE